MISGFEFESTVAYYNLENSMMPEILADLWILEEILPFSISRGESTIFPQADQQQQIELQK